MKSIGIFGGTFNPIHNGHVNLIEKVIESLRLDKIIIMPTKIPPHKIAINLASSSDRLEMCRLAFNSIPKIEVSDYEISQGGKSFSVFTLRHLKEMYPQAEIYLFMGSDMILSFHTWHLYKEILKLATIVAVSRINEDKENIVEYSKIIDDLGGKCIIIQIEPYEISSTQIRKAISQNQEYSCYLPEKVVNYIRSNNLYK